MSLLCGGWRRIALICCWAMFCLLSAVMPGRGLNSWKRKRGHYLLYLRQNPSPIKALSVILGESLHSLSVLRDEPPRRTASRRMGRPWKVRRLCRIVFPGVLAFIPRLATATLSVSGELRRPRFVADATIVDLPSTPASSKRQRLGEVPLASPLPFDSHPIGPDDIRDDSSNEILQHVMNVGCDVSLANAVESMNVLIVESLDDDATEAPSYRRFAGELGGLHESRAGHWKGIHIQIPGVRGFYLSADLHKYPHYQVPMSDLPDYIRDMNDLGISAYEANASIPSGVSAALVYYPSKSYNRSNSPFVQYGGDDATADRNFMSLERELCPSKIVNWIARANSTDTTEDRGNPRLDFSFSPLNATDRVNPRYRGYNGPKIVSAHDQRHGWSSDNRSADLSSAMVIVSRMMDNVTDALDLPRLMNDGGRNEMFSHVIGKVSGRADYRRNKAEGLSMSISSKLLLCHLDSLNDYSPGYNWNASYYGIFPNPNATNDNDEPEYLRLHVGIYSRRICGTTYHKVENSTQVAKDLDSWLKVILQTSPDRKFVLFVSMAEVKFFLLNL